MSAGFDRLTFCGSNVVLLLKLGVAHKLANIAHYIAKYFIDTSMNNAFQQNGIKSKAIYSFLL